MTGREGWSWISRLLAQMTPTQLCSSITTWRERWRELSPIWTCNEREDRVKIQWHPIYWFMLKNWNETSIIMPWGRWPLYQTWPKNCMKHGTKSGASDLVQHTRWLWHNGTYNDLEAPISLMNGPNLKHCLSMLGPLVSFFILFLELISSFIWTMCWFLLIF